MQPFEFISARTITELCQLLQIPGRTIIAGGTDLIPQLRSGKKKVAELIDISQIQELKNIQADGNSIYIGSMVTFQDLCSNSLIQQYAPLLHLASGQIGAPMTRSRATLGGNIANASPAADSIPPLLCMNANLHLQSNIGERVIPLEGFISDPGKTRLMQGEFIKSISFSSFHKPFHYAYIKNGARRGMSISVISVSVSFLLDNNRIIEPSIAVGAAAPTAIRCRKAEEALRNAVPENQSWFTAARISASETIPISDVRASKEYRQEIVSILVERALAAAYSSRIGDNHATS